MKYLRSQLIFLFLCLTGTTEVSAQVPGSNIFNSGDIHEVRINMSQENYWDSLLYYKEEGDVDGEYTFMVCSVEFNRPLTYNMLEEPSFRKIYLDKVYDLVLHVFIPDILFPGIDSLYASIREAVHMDLNKIIGNDLFEENINHDVYIQDYPGWVPGLKSFISQRHQFLQAQLQELGYSFTVHQGMAKKPRHPLIVFPNPAFDHITLKAHFRAGQGYTFELLNISGQVIVSKDIHSPLERVDLSPFPNGFYIIRVMDNEQIRQKKILKL